MARRNAFAVLRCSTATFHGSDQYTRGPQDRLVTNGTTTNIRAWLAFLSIALHLSGDGMPYELYFLHPCIYMQRCGYRETQPVSTVMR